MSAESLAAFRRSVGPELAQLAEEHIQHDLQPSDRETLMAASRTLSTHALVGSMIGLGLGGLLAFRLRRARTQIFTSMMAKERPTHFKFADGREVSIPDMTNMMKPTPLGDVATYGLLGMGGLFFGGETGVMTGSWSARRRVEMDGESKARIERAWKNFKADVLRKQVAALESGKGESEGVLGEKMW